MKKKMIRVACLLLAIIVMLCPLSVCFAAEETLVTLVGSEIINILWGTLKGWGIEILESGYNEITENVKQWLTGNLYEYLEDELHETFDFWITGMQFYRDQFGRLIGNSEYVEAADEFADHLRQAFGIVSNSIVYLHSNGYYLGDLTLYKLPIYGIYHDNQGDHDIICKLDESTQIDPWVVLGRYNNMDHLFLLNSYQGSEYILRIRKIENDTSAGVSAGSFSYQYVKSSSNSIAPWWTQAPDGFTGSQYLFYGDHYTPEEISAGLYNSTTVHTSGIYAENGDILLPSANPSYHSGYSIIYYPDGTIGYLDIDWPETISVDNLPAIVSTGTVANPGIQSVFLPIKSFINTFEDGLGLMTQIVYNLPSEIVGMALAIMGAIIIFGTIKIMKEH